MTTKIKLSSGIEFEEITGERGEYLRKKFFMYKDGVIKANPGGWILPKTFIKYADLVHNFEIKPTDIVLMTFPKSGTTWVQEIIWNLVHNPDLDNPAANLSLDARFPNYESDMFLALTEAPLPDPEGDAMKLFAQLCPGKHYSEGILAHLAAFAPPPRMLKDHLQFCILPPNLLDTCKVVYVARDPRDVITSLYHYARLQKLWGFTGTLDEFVDLVIADEAPYCPYWTHLKLAWDNRDHPNLCIVFFEDLKKDCETGIKRIDKFLGTNCNDQQIKNIVKHTSFSQMKERTKDNPPTSNDNRFFNKEVEEKEGGFFRKGAIGDWKNRFTPEQVEKLNAWMSKNLAQFGDDFKYKV